MKKHIVIRILSLLLSTVLFLTLLSCGNDNSESDLDAYTNLTPDIHIFHAEVLAHNAYDYDYWRSDALMLVYSVTPTFAHDVRGRYFISQNDSVSILNINGEPISHTDVPFGAIVEIVYYGLVLQTSPAVIPNAISVQIVDNAAVRCTVASDGPVNIVNVDARPLLHPGSFNPETSSVAKGANDFTFRLGAMLAQDAGNDNLVVSPYSIWLPLAALLNATDEANRAVLQEALGAGGVNVEDVNSAASRMLFDLTNSGTDWLDNPLHIANAIFVDNGVTLRRNFAQTFADYFRGTVMNVDFRSQEAVDAVNQWAYDNTNGLITDIIQEFDPTTIAAITNAIYFSDSWIFEFRADATRQDVFHSPTGEINTDFMRHEKMMLYYENNYLQMVTLPFGSGGGLSILLPRYMDATELLSSMTAQYFQYIHRNSAETHGELLLPKFSIESKLTNLPDILTALGVPLFCGKSAPLTGGLIYDDVSIWLSDAVHKAMIEIDEKGATAAAVTVMVIAMSGPPPSPFPPFVMRCDKPFVFVLHQPTFDGGAQVLFVGIVNQP